MALVNSQTTVNGYNAAVRDAWLSKNFMFLFTQRSPIWAQFQAKGRIKPAGYGVQMREPLAVPVTTGPMLQGVANPYAYIEAQPMTGFTTATYPLSEYAMNISWDEYDMKRAGNPTEMVDWVQAIMENAWNRAMNKIMDDFWADPSLPASVGTRTQIMSIRTALNAGSTSATDGGASPAAQASQSVAGIVGTSGATVQYTVGGIPRNVTGGAYWCTPMINGSPYSPGSTALTVLVLNDIYEEAFQDGMSPDLITCPTALFSKLQNLLTVGGSNGGTIYGPGDTAKFGFSHLNFRGAKIIPDRRCPTAGYISGTSTATGNQLFCMNTEYLTWRCNGNRPVFKEVVTTQPIHQEVGTWFVALTGRHLGNVHSVAYNLTQ